MGPLGVGDTQAIAVFCQVAAYIFNDRMSHIREINMYQAATRAGHLIHEAGWLAEVNVFSVLTDDSDVYRRKLHIIIDTGYNRSDDRFKSSGRGETCANQHVAGNIGPETADFAAMLLNALQYRRGSENRWYPSAPPLPPGHPEIR